MTDFADSSHRHSQLPAHRALGVRGSASTELPSDSHESDQDRIAAGHIGERPTSTGFTPMTGAAALSDLLEAAFDDLGIHLEPATRRRLKAHLTDLMTAHHVALVNRSTR